jgi:hypothetical protein
MKKYIYKFSILTLAIIAFVGCNVDDDDPIVVDPARSLTASSVEQSTTIPVANDATNYDLVINFSQALPSYSSIEYTFDGETRTASANSGATSVTIPVSFGLTDAFHDIVLVDFIMVNASGLNYLPTIDGTTSFKVMKEGAVVGTLTWEGGADLDFDFDVMTATWAWAFVTLDASAGTTNSETVAAVVDDGNYAFWIWTNGAPNDYPYTITVTTVNGTESFNGTVSGNSWNLWFTKNGTSFTFFEEDPS